MRAASGSTRLVAAIVAALTFVGIGQTVDAQISGATDLPYQQRFLTEQLRPLIAPEFVNEPSAERLTYDYGAVLRYGEIWLQDSGAPGLGDFQASRGAHLWEIRPWFSASVDNVHHVFVRGQYGFMQYEKGDSFIRNSEWQGPFVDIGFYQLDIDEAARRYRCEWVEDWAADLTVGRQFLFLGRGLAYALTTDAVVLDGSRGEWGGMIFGSRSIPHYDNIDISAPSFERSDRRFFGGQLEYQGFDHHELYAFALMQRDRSGEVIRVAAAGGGLVPIQRFDYDSEYWGIGATGEAIFGLPEECGGITNLQYYAEFILQTGRSYADLQATRREDIHGWATDLGLVYQSNERTAPRFDIEYAHASGDSDRRAPQATSFGNRVGTRDTGFLGFGYINTGVSFAPLLANLRFVRLGASCFPFENDCQDCYSNWLRNMQVGANAFAYWRPQERGGTSDIRNDLPGSSYLGSELDFYVSWRLSSDLYMLANYGLFNPNDKSFSVNSSRQFVGWSLNWLL
jgi:hypothetical protein